MKSIMISGPDGTGKSTIIEATRRALESKNIDVIIVWLRFYHRFAKVVNAFGRLIGKSYREKYSWGEVGYHNYKGIFGVIYILTVYLDHLLFRKFIKSSKVKIDKVYLVDRYIIDIVADLIVDTENVQFVFYLFERYVKEELEAFNTFILECDMGIVISRRDDIKDDKTYLKKIDAYKLISQKYNIKRLNTGVNNIDEIVKKIINS